MSKPHEWEISFAAKTVWVVANGQDEAERKALDELRDTARILTVSDCGESDQLGGDSAED